MKLSPSSPYESKVNVEWFQYERSSFKKIPKQNPNSIAKRVRRDRVPEH